MTTIKMIKQERQLLDIMRHMGPRPSVRLIAHKMSLNYWDVMLLLLGLAERKVIPARDQVLDEQSAAFVAVEWAGDAETARLARALFTEARARNAKPSELGTLPSAAALDQRAREINEAA